MIKAVKFLPDGVEMMFAFYFISDASGVCVRFKVTASTAIPIRETPDVFDFLTAVAGEGMSAHVRKIAPDLRAMTRDEIAQFKTESGDEEGAQ